MKKSIDYQEYLKFCDDWLWRKFDTINTAINDLELKPKSYRDYQFSIYIYLRLKYPQYIYPIQNIVTLISKDFFLWGKYTQLRDKYYQRLFQFYQDEKYLWKTLFLTINDIETIFKLAQSTMKIYQQKINNNK